MLRISFIIYILNVYKLKEIDVGIIVCKSKKATSNEPVCNMCKIRKETSNKWTNS